MAGAQGTVQNDETHEAAAAAGLRYVSDEEPGISRKRSGKGFSFYTPDGELLKDKAQIRRIRSLAIPPAYRDVWICTDPEGHIQATGRDDRGRKQYRYHPDWREAREAEKFDRMILFGQKLPVIRERVRHDLGLRGLRRDKVLATVVRLLETTLIRVGNEEYARENRSFGLTTLRDRHVEFEGSKLVFEFRGKGGKVHEISVRDRRLTRIVHACQDLPGQHLFQYIDDDGNRQPVESADVNAYLREVTGEPFTAKDFRTWAGTVLASLALSQFERVDTKVAARRNIKQAIGQVSGLLGNTVAVCRKSYIHPIVVDSYLDGTLLAFLKSRVEDALRQDLEGLSAEEGAVLAFLQQRLTEETRTHRPEGRVEQRKPRDLRAGLKASLAEEASPAKAKREPERKRAPEPV